MCILHIYTNIYIYNIHKYMHYIYLPFFSHSPFWAFIFFNYIAAIFVSLAALKSAGGDE